jgi:hypothetical protein
MPETNPPCPDPRLARQVAFLHFLRLPLLGATAILALCLIQTTVACFSPPEGDANAIVTEPMETNEAVGAQEPPTGDNIRDESAVCVELAHADKTALPPAKQGPTTGQTGAPRQTGKGLGDVICRFSRESARDCSRTAGEWIERGRAISIPFASALAFVRQTSRELVRALPRSTGAPATSQSHQASASPPKPSPVEQGPPPVEQGPPAVKEAPLPVKVPPAGLTLLNPAETGVTVLYLLDDTAQSLRPGERKEWPASGPRQVRFHRGEDYGNAEYLLESGVYAFRVTEHGWELAKTGSTPPDSENTAP